MSAPSCCSRSDIFPVCAPAIGARLKTVADLAHEWVITRENTAWSSWERWFAQAGVAR